MNELLNTLIPALVVLILAFTGLGITILLKKGGKFPNTHIHGNKALNSQGIHCVQNDDQEEQIRAGKRIDYHKLKPDTKK